jgi:hypothetical protein
LANAFSGIIFAVLAVIASLVLFVCVGALVVFSDEELRAKFLPSKKREKHEHANARTFSAGGD